MQENEEVLVLSMREPRLIQGSKGDCGGSKGTNGGISKWDVLWGKANGFLF